jgi:amino acid transporter
MVGRARPSAHLEHTLLPKVLALPVFASDALSSVAYATEAALFVLVSASISARTLVMPIAVVIALLMVMVVVSYRQTVRAYPTAAGSYVVSKDNLGVPAGLIAAAALLIDYVLTVSVSVVAGVLAITSAAPALAPYKVELSLASVAVIALANLRGLRESGLLVALPTYGFICSIFAMLAFGFFRCVGGCPRAIVPDPVTVGPIGVVGIAIILHAFASGSTALTGVEAISNGVSAFRRPQWRNAQQTLTIMGAIAVTMFLGVTALAVAVHALPSTSVSVISEIARTAFPGRGSSGGPMFFVVQAFTFAILIFAANTSFQDFPRLSAILARDRFLPRQFENRGDRLVFSNGVLVLAVFSSLLIVIFRASVDALIQLYVVGVFTAFTLSQTGMVKHWFRAARQGGEDATGWRRRAFINGLGGVATGVVTLIVVWTKFKHGAWVVIVAVPLIVAGFYAVRRHYARVNAELHLGAVSVEARTATSVVLYVDDVGPATARALGYVRSFSDDFRAVHVTKNGLPADLVEQWGALARGAVPLDIVSAKRNGVDALLDYVRAVPRQARDFVTVVVPETFAKPSLVSALRAPTFSVKLRLLNEPGVVITDVPVLSPPDAPEPVRAAIPYRREALVLISGVNDAVVQAVNYAASLHPDSLRAVFFAYEAADVEPVWREWLERRIPVELDLVDAPFRDLGPPVLQEVREATRRPGTLVNVIVPELVVPNRRHEFLHNQRALFIKRLLLFEPGVVLTSVPYRVRSSGPRATGRPAPQGVTRGQPCASCDTPRSASTAGAPTAGAEATLPSPSTRTADGVPETPNR